MPRTAKTIVPVKPSVIAAIGLLLAAAPWRGLAAEHEDVPTAALHASVVIENQDGTAIAPQPGDTVIIRARFANKGMRDLIIDRTELETGPALRPHDPVTDRLDNDRNTTVDDIDEIAEIDGGLLAWSGLDRLLAPGETMEFWARAKIADDPPQVLTARARASGSVPEGGEAGEKVRAAVKATLRVSPLRLVLTRRTPSDPAIILYHDDRLVTEARLSLPPGPAIPAIVTVTAPAAAGRLEGAEGMAPGCPDAEGPTHEGNIVTWRLGACSAAEAVLTLRYRTMDADPFAADAQRRRHRAAALEVQIVQGDTVVAARSPLMLAGALLAVEPVMEEREAEFDAGDTLTARYRMTNAGDGRPVRVMVSSPDAAALNCATIEIAIDGRTVGGCDGLIETILAAGSSVEITVRGDVSAGVSLDGPLTLAPRLSALPEIGLPPRIALRPFMARPRLPKAPVLSAETPPIAAPGVEIPLRLTLQLPEGRIESALALRARAARGDTGEPLGPAAVELVSASVTLPDEEPRALGTVEALERKGWHWLEIPLGVLGISGAAPGPRYHPVVIDARIRVVDTPLLRSGRLLQIGAVSATGGHVAEATSIIEAPVEEPRLTLVLRTEDRDRLIRPSDRVSLNARGCNIGGAAAHGVSLRLLAGAHMSFEEPVAATRTTPGGDKALPAVAEASEIRLRDDGWDGALAPGDCLLMGATARAGTDPPPDSDLLLKAVFADYRGLPEATGRLYTAPAPVTVALRAPALRLSKVAAEETLVEPGDAVAKRFAIEAPDRGGPYRISIRPTSSAGLEWRLRRRIEDGGSVPWHDGTEMKAGEIELLELETRAPASLPAGWVDTTVLRAAAVSPAGETREATLRWIVRGRPKARGGRLEARKSMALDRNCDGRYMDESLQDAIFEPYKEAQEGECIIFRIEFENVGEKSMQQVVIRDTPPPGTSYLEGSARIGDAPEALFASAPETWPQPGGDLVWRFKGMLSVHDYGTVEYAVRVGAP